MSDTTHTPAEALQEDNLTAPQVQPEAPTTAAEPVGEIEGELPETVLDELTPERIAKIYEQAQNLVAQLPDGVLGQPREVYEQRFKDAQERLVKHKYELQIEGPNLTELIKFFEQDAPWVLDPQNERYNLFKVLGLYDVLVTARAEKKFPAFTTDQIPQFNQMMATVSGKGIKTMKARKWVEELFPSLVQLSRDHVSDVVPYKVIGEFLNLVDAYTPRGLDFSQYFGKAVEVAAEASAEPLAETEVSETVEQQA